MENIKKNTFKFRNEGFDTDTWTDRLEILREISCFQVYVTMNEITGFNDDKKIDFITDIAKKLNETINIKPS